ncbi:MAG TPA: single-stranded DNA-binding protein [Acidimicrobiales bacterium]|nr:single-stranded DNA-binding protein [Acidimicrobiales bacterium]
MNIVLLHGLLTREPEIRSLPSGDEVASFDLTVRDDGFETEVVPISWHAAPAHVLERLEAGSEIVVTGRVRRRFFRAGGATQSRTEVIATSVLPARQSRGVDKALRAALATGDEWLGG